MLPASRVARRPAASLPGKRITRLSAGRLAEAHNVTLSAVVGAALATFAKMDPEARVAALLAYTSDKRRIGA
jgi:hypothetical protein